MHDLETLRSATGLSSSLVLYFTNGNLNQPGSLSVCMDSIAEKVYSHSAPLVYSPTDCDQVIRGSISNLNSKASEQSLPRELSAELRELLVCSTHRVKQAREIASRYLHRLITSFPSLMCDPPLVYAILEILTLLRQACDNEYYDEASSFLLRLLLLPFTLAHNTSCSTTLCTSSTLGGPGSHSSCRTITKSAGTYSRNCSATPRTGSVWLWLVHPWSCSPRSRCVSCCFPSEDPQLFFLLRNTLP